MGLSTSQNLHIADRSRDDVSENSAGDFLRDLIQVTRLWTAKSIGFKTRLQCTVRTSATYAVYQVCTTEHSFRVLPSYWNSQGTLKEKEGTWTPRGVPVFIPFAKVDVTFFFCWVLIPCSWRALQHNSVD